MSLAAILALLDSAQADFNTAVAAYAQGNFTAAFQDFLKLAKEGDVMAQDIVAFMYHRGNGVKKDDVQAYMWLDVAARGGDPDAARFRDELVAPGMKPTEIAKAKELSKSSSLHGENTVGPASPAEAQTSAKREAAPASAATAAPVETASVPPVQITPKSPQEKPPETPKPVEQPPSTQAAQPPSSPTEQPPSSQAEQQPSSEAKEPPSSETEQAPSSLAAQPQPSQAASARIEQPPPSEAQPSPPSSEARQSSPPPQPSPPVKVTPERIALAKSPDPRALRPGDRAAPSRAPIESEAAQQSPERGWTVQLAAVQGEPQAQREWERLKQAHPDLLSELTPTFERFEIGDKHDAVYRVRVGSWKNVKAPIALCNKLKEKGERCFVARRSS